MTEPVSAAPPHRVGRPVMRQSWRDLTFLHWEYDAAVVRRLIPAGLQLDLFNGSAWVGLVLFRMADVTLPRWPALPWLSKFPETNVRTYVLNGRGQRGVWFFSLDAARLPAVVAGRLVFSLPYYWSKMRVHRLGGLVRYFGRRRQPLRCGYSIEVRIGEPLAAPMELELFLTARWRLYAERAGQIRSVPIEHQPWPLQRAEVTALRQDLIEAAGLPSPAGTPLVHFAGRVDVPTGGLE